MLLQRITIRIKCLSVIFKKKDMLIPHSNLYKCYITFSIYTHHDQSEHESTGLPCCHSSSCDTKSQLHASWSKHGWSNQPFGVLHLVLMFVLFQANDHQWHYSGSTGIWPIGSL